MEAREIREFMIVFSDEDLEVFSSLVYKLKHKPQKVGFQKTSLSDAELQMIDNWYSYFDYPESGTPSVKNHAGELHRVSDEDDEDIEETISSR